ncbi:YheC/YheD family protein [Marininema halotolerans]|uniref:YheC/D like ATP-grasp n=1 Tax=Marininema halotolerans TaxID=1155944 RepID=A0A1I6TMZ5_9BACL|nr:YheC/YheD family protein [Marininema halotolerans]SFS90555.1 YheC/D like ATP-grasp [Marininema halotolerans]
MASSYDRNKVRIARLLGPHPATQSVMPTTVLFTRQNLQQMIKKHPMLYLKPSAGCQSRGVIRVTRGANGYIIRGLYRRNSVLTSSELYTTLQRQINGQRYIIQQGIDSEDRQGNHFDIRVHLFRINRQWKVGGMAARVAEPNGIVAGLHQGGTALTLPRFMMNHLGYGPGQQNNVTAKLEDAALKAVRIVSKTVPRKSEMAVDMGIDRSHRVWIFEVNYALPAIRLFQFADKDLFRKLLSLRKKAQ